MGGEAVSIGQLALGIGHWAVEMRTAQFQLSVVGCSLLVDRCQPLGVAFNYEFVFPKTIPHTLRESD
jgi:hypothetical protein